MKKSLRKVIVAVIALVISIGVATSTTFAWFSMNNTVTITGLTIQTTVSSNLFIAEDTLGSTSKKGDEFFVSSVDTAIGPVLVEPTSTVDGKKFFYTIDAKADGSKDQLTSVDPYVVYNAVEVPTSTELTAFNTAYGTTNAVGYVDYVVQLKAVNTDTTNAKDIKITQLDLTYATTGTVVTGIKAYRVALFVEDITTTSPAGGSGTLVGIYTPASAVNHTSGKAVKTTTDLDSVTYNAATRLTQVTANSTEYFKVVIRLYLEGEDTTCTNDTFLELTANWSFDVTFEFDTATSNVTNLTVKSAE